MKVPTPRKLSWHNKAKQYRIYAGGQRFWLGADEVKAQRLALDIRQLAKDFPVFGPNEVATVQLWQALIHGEDPVGAAGIAALIRAYAPAGKQVQPPLTEGSMVQPVGGATTTLHEAIAAYQVIIRVSQAKSSHWISVAMAQAGEIKKVCTDRLLSGFDRDAILGVHDHWVGRVRKGELSPRTAKNLLAGLRAFLVWLDGKHGWTAPKVVLKVPAHLRRPLEPRSFTMAQLAALWQACKSDNERVVFLLGLNCGFTEVDISTLTAAMIMGGRLTRPRHKTGASGQWVLWVETVAVLKEGPPKLTVGQIAHLWRKIRAAAGVSGAGTGFKHLRKTGAQFLRDKAGHELAEAFLAHRTPGVGGAYTGFRDWDGLDTAIMKLRETLNPVFK